MEFNSWVIVVAIVAVCATVCYLARIRERRRERTSIEWTTIINRICDKVIPMLENYVNRH